MTNNSSKSRCVAQTLGVLSTLGICMLSAVVDYVSRHFKADAMWYTNIALWVGVAMLLLLVLPNWIYNWNAITNRSHRNIRERMSLLVANSCSGNVVDIALILTFLIYTAQISTSMNDVIVNRSFYWRPFIYVVALAISVVQKPLLLQDRRQNTHKVLITGLSNITYSVKPGTEFTNIEPIISALKRYSSSIEKLVLIVTKESYKRIKKPEFEPTAEELSGYPLYSSLSPYFDKSGEELSDAELTELIRNLCGIPGLIINFSQRVDFNSFKECNEEILRQVKDIQTNKVHQYDDCDLLFNITPGTKMLTGAMTINAIKGERAIVYISQDKNDRTIEERVKEYDPNVGDLYEQFSELAMEVSERNNK